MALLQDLRVKRTTGTDRPDILLLGNIALLAYFKARQFPARRRPGHWAAKSTQRWIINVQFDVGANCELGN